MYSLRVHWGSRYETPYSLSVQILSVQYGTTYSTCTVTETPVYM